MTCELDFRLIAISDLHTSLEGVSLTFLTSIPEVPSNTCISSAQPWGFCIAVIDVLGRRLDFLRAIQDQSHSELQHLLYTSCFQHLSRPL